MVVKPGEGHPSKQIVRVCMYVCLCVMRKCVCKEEALQSRRTAHDHERSGTGFYEHTGTTTHTQLYTSTAHKGEVGQTHGSGLEALSDTV